MKKRRGKGSKKKGFPASSGVDVYLDRGFKEIEKSEFESARAYFDEALRLNPACARAYLGRGLAWHYLGEVDNALADYDATLRLDPRNARALLDRGAIRHRRGDLGKAVADYTKALAVDPKNATAYSYRASVRAKEEDYPKALRDLEKVIALDPSDADARFHRAKVYDKLGDSRSALAEIEATLQLDPLHASALEKRSSILQERGDHSRAERDTERAREIRSNVAAGRGSKKRRTLVASLLREHFHPETTDNLTITQREFPFRVRADLQRATESLFSGKTRIHHYCGVRQPYSHEGLDFTGLIAPNEHSPPVSVPPEYEEIDIGEEAPVRCPTNALWLLEEEGRKYAVLFCPAGQFGNVTGLKFQIATVNDPEGTRITQEFFKHLEESVLRSESYRGKVLSLESREMYSGASTGILVHRLRDVSREQVILPRKTLDLLDRNVLAFSRQRKDLAKFGLSTKKGILFYGPPGTGKTHTIHYLARALEGHTTFLVTAGQMGLFSEYMTLARLLQPSLVVIEDVDLIARDRDDMDNPCVESLLNVLLNEMDGLRQDADVFFLLTTNRPESLEAALASRPGRIDQAIEYPLPDEEGREKLIRLYSHGLDVPEDVVRRTVRKTKGVSASFIRELMRRAAQFRLEGGGSSGDITMAEIDAALDELLVAGGSLNRKLLGADGAAPDGE